MSRHGLIDGAIVGAGERFGALPCGRDRPFCTTAHAHVSFSRLITLRKHHVS